MAFLSEVTNRVNSFDMFSHTVIQFLKNILDMLCKRYTSVHAYTRNIANF